MAERLLVPAPLRHVGDDRQEAGGRPARAGLRDIGAVHAPLAQHRVVHLDLELHRLAAEHPMDVRQQEAVALLADHLVDGVADDVFHRAAEPLGVSPVHEAVAARRIAVGDVHRRRVGDELQLPPAGEQLGFGPLVRRHIREHPRQSVRAPVPRDRRAHRQPEPAVARLHLNRRGITPRGEIGQRGEDLAHGPAHDRGELRIDQRRERPVAAHHRLVDPREAHRIGDRVEHQRPVAGSRAHLRFRVPRAQQSAHRGDELGRLDRMHQIAVCATFQPAHPGVGIGQAGREVEHRDVVGGGVGLDAAAELEAVDVGESDIEHDEVRPGRERVQALTPGGGLEHTEAMLAQDPAHGVAVGLGVVHHEDLMWAPGIRHAVPRPARHNPPIGRPTEPARGA